MVGEVRATPGKREIEAFGAGAILLNKPTKQTPYLITKREFGDVEVHLEFMVPEKSNAGLYLMGRYEIQIFDSFGKDEVKHSDLGGLYQRWDPSRGKGHQGYEGVGPSKNAAKAPGEWQTLDIVFRAPRFDASGRKTENARFVKVAVNGVTVHENQEVTGPTRAHPVEGEAARGPLAVQGDHGPVAIRRFAARAVELD